MHILLYLKKKFAIHMFSTKQNQMINQESAFTAKQQMLSKSIARQQRQKIKRRMRQMNAIEIIPFKGVRLNQFLLEVQSHSNPYCLALTMFQIAQQINWRSYAPYLEAVIRTFHNLCNTDISTVTVLAQIQNFEKRLANMMYLGDVALLQHLKLLLIFLLRLDEEKLSEHILWMHRSGIDIFWLLARIKVSSVTIGKLFKAKIENCHLLPVLTIIGNFIVQANPQVVLQLVKKIEFQNLIQKGLCNEIYEITRQTIFLINNILCKNQQLYQYMTAQTNLVFTILNTQNEETAVFKQLLALK